jgi:hypothetical protein
MKCTVCNLNQTKEIDRALLTGVTLTSLSRKYGLSISALHRHKDHLHKKMHRAETRLQASLHQGFFFKLNTLLDLAMQTALTASADGNSRLFLQAGSLGSRIINQMTKMDVQLEPEMVYCLMASPKWNMTDSLLPGAFQALSDTRQTLATDLLAPCADPEPELVPDQAQTSLDEASFPDLETLLQSGDLDDQSRDLLYKEFPSLVQRQTAQPEPADDKLENKWEKTGKSPKYSRHSDEIYEGYLRDIEREKNVGSAAILPLNSCPGRYPVNISTLETRNSELGTPANRPKNLPDRHREEDFGNPRKIKGCS